MGVLVDQTSRLVFSEALSLLIEEYRQRHVDRVVIADDLFNAAEELLRDQRRAQEERTYG